MRAQVPLQPTDASPSGLLGITCLVTSLLGWSSIPLFLSHFAHSIDGWTANGWRYGFSAILWLPVLLFKANRGTTPPGLWRAAAIPSLFNIAAQVCFGLAPYHVSPGLMTFALRLQIVFVTIGAAVLFAAERRVIRSPGFLTGIALVIVGTVATIAFKPGGLGGGTLVGVSLAVMSGILYAGYALSVRKFMVGLPPLIAFAAVSQITAVGMVTLMFIFADRSGMGAMDLSRGQFGLLLLSAFIGIGLGHTCYFTSIARLGLATSAGVVQLQPVLVSIGSNILFDEVLTPLQWGAGTLAIAGAGLVLWTQAKASRAQRRARIDEFDDLPVDEGVAMVAGSNEIAPIVGTEPRAQARGPG